MEGLSEFGVVPIAFLSSWNHIRKVEEQMAGGGMPCWGSFLTPRWSSWLVRTLRMSEIPTSKVPLLKPFALQIIGCEFGE